MTEEQRAEEQTKMGSILVVGGGISGLTATLEAAEVGYEVFLVEKNPYLGGRVAGLNMAGRETPYEGGTGMNALHSFGYPILSAGMVSVPEDEAGYEVLTEQSADGKRQYDGSIEIRQALRKGGIMEVEG